MLSVNYGNFLTKSEAQKASYEFNRPIINLVASTICTFCVTGAALTAALCAYAYLLGPEPSFSSDDFAKAQSLNNNLSKGIAVMKQARPNGINVMSVVSQITEHKPSDVSIENIKVVPGHYAIKGFAKDQELANEFASALDFGKDFQCAVTSISFEKGVYAFTVEASAKAKATPKASQNKGGANNV